MRALLSAAALAVGSALYFFFQSEKETKKDAETQTNVIVAAPPAALPKVTLPVAEESKDRVRLVVQRFRQASLLVDGKVVSVGERCDSMLEPTTAASCGLVVYISFAKSATTEKALQAARTVLNLPLLTHGAWGDGSMTTSVLDMASSPEARPYLMLVPQANIISKIKSQGKSLQYHGQIDKEVGKQLYEEFLNYVRALLLEHQCITSTPKQPVPRWVTAMLDSTKSTTVDASVAPNKMFRDKSTYSEWDIDGIPTRDANGNDLTKSALKKLKKQRDGQKKRHGKYLKAAASTNKSQATESTVADWSLLNPEYCTVVGGTFGARQGLDISSDMGPFCHVVSL
jgi:D-Tyr-tRNAtyr deacylase